MAWPGLEGSTKMVTGMPRKMPLVPNMIEELVCSLPPLEESKVLDLLRVWNCSSGDQCKQALSTLNTSLDRELQMEVWSCVNTH